MESNVGVGVSAEGSAVGNGGVQDTLGMSSTWLFEAYDKDGNLKWVEEVKNRVVNVGLNDVIDKYFKGSSYTAAFYVGLTDGTPTTAAGDTMASHPGWVEVTAYTQASRPALTLGAVSSQSANNGASRASYTINAASTTIGGAFITTNATKGGTAGTLYSVAAFTLGDKGLDTDDVLNVTVTVNAAST